MVIRLHICVRVELLLFSLHVEEYYVRPKNAVFCYVVPLYDEAD
jgi:hypothetical protein